MNITPDGINLGNWVIYLPIHRFNCVIGVLLRHIVLNMSPIYFLIAKMDNQTNTLKLYLTLFPNIRGFGNCVTFLTGAIFATAVLQSTFLP